jgi:hypothetical protein
MITYVSYSTAGLASEGGAARTHQRHRNKRRLASTKDHFLLNCSQCWRNRDAEEHPQYSVFSINLHAGAFSSALPLFVPVPKLRPSLSLIHQSRSRCLSQTSNPVFQRSHARRHPCISSPHQQKPITIEKNCNCQTLLERTKPSFLTPCAGLAHRSRGPHPGPTSRYSPFISLHKRYDDDPKTTTYSRRYAASIARLVPHSDA